MAKVTRSEFFTTWELQKAQMLIMFTLPIRSCSTSWVLRPVTLNALRTHFFALIPFLLSVLKSFFPGQACFFHPFFILSFHFFSQREVPDISICSSVSPPPLVGLLTSSLSFLRSVCLVSLASLSPLLRACCSFLARSSFFLRSFSFIVSSFSSLFFKFFFSFFQVFLLLFSSISSLFFKFFSKRKQFWAARRLRSAKESSFDRDEFSFKMPSGPWWAICPDLQVLLFPMSDFCSWQLVVERRFPFQGGPGLV